MKINVQLSKKSIQSAIAQLEEYRNSLDAKAKRLAERLATIGKEDASIRFTQAFYDGYNDTEVSVETSETGYVVVASGEAVCFIEFGAGVYFNGSEPYPNPRPAGVVGIGEYGQGKGKRQGWVYLDMNDQRVFTRGSPAAMPMYFATKEMRDALTEIAREVFQT